FSLRHRQLFLRVRFERNIKATKLRIELLKDKKYFNTVKLVLFYFNCYHKSRSIPVELKMAVKG
ncbi:MAG: hypothetical protein K2J91_04145, partial [Lachnospiraceae bacterium]|nr:hypothetical protein [Lachnospiraceae bacterium]